ncbi:MULTISPECIES: hypothetical protein [unclassified Pseudofrankia]|uniref:hypothetical protein n=1 Tax=unclassified Pseudofrankia TaxID=2994372 RepID=UPI0008D951A2|nr:MULTISPECIES: hypothetical protein [unclassified Pseudofrankia]MDT3446949.1 hypothetical protein [Pseudofrankia sp. BMG5.37]OHV52335.1 hypothetical protein BCD48_44975 [Pseudofrankia sp. BMG5.36]
MALRDKLAERAKPYLQPDEEVRHVFMAQTGPTPYLFIVTYLILFAIHYRIVVVTDKSITVLKAGKLVPSKPKGDTVLARIPRETRLGPVKGLWGVTEATGEKLRVHKRFHKDIEAADAEIAGLSTSA